MEKFVQLIVLDKKGVYLEARASNGGVLFDDLPLLPGFPRKLKFREEFIIEVVDFSEIMYVRELSRRDAYGDEEIILSPPWFIQVSPTEAITKAYVPEG